MQAFNFGIRNSATPSVDDTQSRYVPSSIYSGPGPAEESPLPPHPQQQYYQNGQRRLSQASNYGQYEQRYDTRPVQSRSSISLNLNDPVVMHLLMETAIMDSKDFEILSFEELEHLKRERAFLRNKIEGAKRQYTLERKMHDAAQLMNKLTPADAEHDPRKKRSSFLGHRSSAVMPADNQMSTSFDKVEQLAQEVKVLENRLQEVETRILHHTAGILQFTHKGLKKNIRKNELPRSPESMASQTRSLGMEGSSDFDERSLYQVPEYVHDFQRPTSRSGRRITKEVQPIEDIAVRLNTLSAQLYNMIQGVVLTEYFEPPPEPSDEGLQGRIGAQIQAYLTYMAQGIEALGSVQGRDVHSTSIPAESSEQLQNLTSKLHVMLERTNSVSKSPLPEDEVYGHDLSSQLSYSAVVLERLTQRVDALLEQKDILTRQIQQQRELNSKSDAQRDAHIRDLTEELEDAKKLQAVSDKEMQQSHDQIELLMEQLDQAKQNEQLLERQRGMNDSKALEAERAARHENEASLTRELEARQHAFTELQADHAKIEHDFELKSQYHIQELNDANTARQQAELDLGQKHEHLQALNAEMQKLSSHLVELEAASAARSQLEEDTRHTNEELRVANAARSQLEEEAKARNEELNAIHSQMREMETQVVQLSSELTMARAELDASYGSRAQRAADVSMNPEIKRQIDVLNAKNAELEQQLEVLSAAHETKGAGSAELQNKVNALQKELKDTIEDYEVMTKASIEFEKEREQLEATIDQMRDHCQKLEVSISEDQVKWIGVKNTLPPETTSTMVLKNEFKKMMRDSRAESIKTIRAEQEERKRLEGMIRALRKESAQSTPSKPPPSLPLRIPTVSTVLATPSSE